MQWGEAPWTKSITRTQYKVRKCNGARSDEDRDGREYADVGPIRSGANVPYVDSIDARSQWPGVKEISNKGARSPKSIDDR